MESSSQVLLAMTGRPGLEPGPMTTDLRCCAKAVDQHLSKQSPRRMGPGLRRTTARVGSVDHDTAVTQFTQSTTALASSEGLLNRCGRRLAKRKLSPCMRVQLSASTVSFILPESTRPASSPSWVYDSSPVLPPGSMWTSNKLRRPSDTAGLS